MEKAADGLKAVCNQTILLVPVLYCTITMTHVTSAVLCRPTMLVMRHTAQVKI
jgi:hypothetical protein